MPRMALILRYLLLAGCCLAGPAALWAQGGGSTLPATDTGAAQTWSTKPDEVLAAAQQSGKPVYVYIWAKFHPDCIRMSEETLLYDQVVAQLGGFERLAVDATNRASFPFLDAHKIPYIKLAPLDQAAPPLAPLPEKNEEVLAQGAARWPTNLFLDSQGTEIFRFYGWMPGKNWAAMLAQVVELNQQWDAQRKDPNSALAEANLGHLYVQLQVFKEAKKHLDRALQLDPNNAVGVVPGVQLDQAILALPDDPAVGKRTIQEWEKRNPGHARFLEAVYYEAVALVALSDYAGATKLLLRFENAKPHSAEFDSTWYRPARELLALIRLQQP